MKLSDLKVDSSAIEAGEWVDSVPDLTGIRLKVRGTGNADFRQLQGKRIRSIPMAQRVDGLSTDDTDALSVELLHKTILLDWDGITDDDGVTPIKYSSDLALKLLSDPDFRVFRNGVAWAGDVVATRRKAAEAQAAKN